MSIKPDKVVEDEAPDFLVSSGGLTIGVEIVEYATQGTVDGYTRRAVEQAWYELRRFAYSDEINRTKYRAYFVHFWFAGALPRRQEFATFLSSVHALIDANRGSLADGSWHEFPGDDLPPYLSRFCIELRIKHIDAYAMWDSNISVGFVGTSEDELLSIILPKLERAYQDCAKLHLALLGDGGSIASYIGFTNPDELSTYQRLNASIDASRFDVISILNGDETCVWERGLGWR